LIGGLVLAAGAGSRFGGDKLTADLGGRPVIDHALAAIAAAPSIGRIVVVTGADGGALAERARAAGAEPVPCPDWADGISASLRTGVETLAECDAVLVVLGDQPFVTAEAIEAIAAEADAPAPAVRAVHGGRPGHPVLIKRELFARVAELRGDQGARDLLAETGVLEVESHAQPDVDTPADLEAARRRLAG
jgi:CTP:molybdopterin cytidylyltransferase MocA